MLTPVPRRFALCLTLFLLPWLIILATPQFRRQLSGTVAGGHLSFKPTPWVGLLDPSGQNLWRVGEPVTLEQKASRIYGGEGIDGVSIINTAKDRDREYWKIFEFGRLSDRYPGEAWLVAMALKNMSSTQDGRVEYEWAASPQARQYVKPTNNFKPEMIREALRLVRRGQSLEPDNAFFDWMEIRLLLISRRDREALALLQKAASKPRYDEHLRAAMEAQLADLEGGARSLLPDERIGTLWSVLLPELSVYRHMRGTLQWRIDQLEQDNRHEEAIALGAALRRISTMQMRAAPFTVTSTTAANGLRGVWRGGNRKPARAGGVQLALLNGLGSSDGYDPKRDEALARRYFQYLSDHGHRELLPEARVQLRDYHRFYDGLKVARRDDLLDPTRNLPLALSNLYWAAGGLALAGVLLSGGLWVLLSPVGRRVDLRYPGPMGRLPLRRAFYPQLVAWAGSALCLAYAGYIEFLVEREPVGCGMSIPEAGDPQILLSFAALALPFAAVGVTQLLTWRATAATKGAPGSWIPNAHELGLPDSVILVCGWAWRVFCGLLIIVGLVFASFAVAGLTGQEPVNGQMWVWWDPLYLRSMLPSGSAPLVTPILVGAGVLLVAVRWVVRTPLCDRVAVLRSVRELRRYCGAYATVFSWLVLLACLCNVPLESNLDRGLQEYLGLEERLSYVGVGQPRPVPVRLQTLPPIPAFPTPTPEPLSPIAPEGEAPPV